MPSEDLGAALHARNRTDLKDVRFRLLMGIPFALFGLLIANMLLSPILIFIPGIGSLGCGGTLLAFNAFLVAVIVLDLRRHPQEEWYRPRYTLTSGESSGPQLTLPNLRGDGGLSSGMPLMTNMSDPRNAATRARTIANGFSNLILAGPRSIQEALALRRKIRARSQPSIVDAATRFTAWLGGRGVLPESEVEARLEAHPSERAGLQLARELEVVTRRVIQGEFHYHVR